MLETLMTCPSLSGKRGRAFWQQMVSACTLVRHIVSQSVGSPSEIRDNRATPALLMMASRCVMLEKAASMVCGSVRSQGIACTSAGSWEVLRQSPRT